MAFTTTDNRQVPAEHTAASRFGNHYDLLQYFSQHILNGKLLTNLVLVSKGYQVIFTPRLWKEMSDDDLKLAQAPEPKLRYIKKFTMLRREEDENRGSGCDVSKLLPQMSNLESFVDFDTTKTTLDLIRQNCPKIRELHLRFVDPEIIGTPSPSERFTNLTSLVIECPKRINSENEWTTFLVRLLDASPGLQELGLFNLGPIMPPQQQGPKSCIFGRLCEQFAQRPPGKRLHLRSLLLGKCDYPPGPLAQDHIQQLTDPKFLEHLHIANAGEKTYRYWNDGNLDRVPGSNTICLPAFISPQSTPNLRLITTLYNSEPVFKWFEDLHSRYPSFVQNLTHRVSKDVRYLDWTNHVCKDFGPICVGWYETRNIAPVGTFNGLLNKTRLVEPLDLPGHNKTFPYGLALSSITSDSAGSLREHNLAQQQTIPAPGPTEQTPALPYKSLTLNNVFWPKPGFHPMDAEILFRVRSYLLHTSSPGALKQLTVYIADELPRSKDKPMPAPRERTARARGLITATMVDLLNGLTTLEDLYFPLMGCTSEREQMAEDEWEKKMILMLADDGVLPRLRHVKILGSCYEVVRGWDNRVVRLVELDRNEEQRLVWFRDMWEAVVEKSR